MKKTTKAEDQFKYQNERHTKRMSARRAKAIKDARVAYETEKKLKASQPPRYRSNGPN